MKNIEEKLNDHKNWVVLPPGDRHLFRYPYPVPDIPPDTEIASMRDILAANFGAPFPWGWKAEPKENDKLWHKHRLGFSELYHVAWFVCREGRVGSAPNVLEKSKGLLRGCLYLDGGENPNDSLDNDTRSFGNQIRSTSICIGT